MYSVYIVARYNVGNYVLQVFQCFRVRWIKKILTTVFQKHLGFFEKDIVFVQYIEVIAVQ